MEIVGIKAINAGSIEQLRTSEFFRDPLTEKDCIAEFFNDGRI